MKRLSFCFLLIFFVQSKCTFVSSSSSLDAFNVQYTDKEYTSQVGTVSIAPLEALNVTQLNAVPLAQRQTYELIFDLLNSDYQYLKMKIFHCDWNWIPSKLNDLEFLSEYNEFNGHFYWIKVPKGSRAKFIATARLNYIELTSHFEPLHDSKAGQVYGKSYVDLSITKSLANQIVRIPIHTQMSFSVQKNAIKALEKTILECFKTIN